MNLFNLPAQCIFDKEISINKLLGRFGKINVHSQSIFASEVESCHLFACLKDSTYPTDNPNCADSYLNEILFLRVALRSHITLDTLTRCILKAFQYQTVVIYTCGLEYCLAAGIVRDAKKIYGDRKIEHHTISQWLSEAVVLSSNFNIQMMSHESYKSIYSSIYSSIQKENEENYLPLSFLADLYAYAHGFEPDLSVKIKLQEKLKESYPKNCVRSKSGAESYRFSEDEVYEIILNTGGYVTGDDLIETLYNFSEFENDFDLQLPKPLQEKISAYAEEMWDEMDNIADEVVISDDAEVWLDCQ